MGLIELQRLADAAGFATASDDMLTPFDDAPVVRQPTVTRSTVPDDPRPRSTSTALVPAKPLWLSQSTQAQQTASLLTPHAQAALRHLSQLLIRMRPAGA
jgi:hypothetical protein